MKTVLITGASGFIGLNLVEVFLAEGWRVVALSLDGIPLYAARQLATSSGELIDVRGDVRDKALLERVLAEQRFDAVVAGAAITAGAVREQAVPAEIFEVNVVAVMRLLELAARYQVPRMLCFSSSAAMGELPFGGRAVLEDDAPCPLTLYGITKASLEHSARRWNSFGNAPRLMVARLTAAIGPWERATGVRDTLSPPLAIVRAVLEGRPIAPLPEGGARDYAYAPEVARQLFWMLTAEQPRHMLYQLSPGVVWHASLMIEALRACGLTVRVEPGGEVIAFNDDLTRTRSPLSAQRIAAEFRAPPGAQEAALAFARWALVNRAWFAR